jgi:hypothetical protein
MLTRSILALAATSALMSTSALAQATAEVPRPAALTVQVVPSVPAELAAKTRAYMELRSAAFAGWNRQDRSYADPHPLRQRAAAAPRRRADDGPPADHL